MKVKKAVYLTSSGLKPLYLSVFKVALALVMLMPLFSCENSAPKARSKSSTYVKMFGGLKNQSGSDIKETADGGYIILGSSNSFSRNDMDMYLLKVDAEGNEEWSKTFGYDKDDFGNALMINREGDYIVLGTSTDAEDFTNLLLMKINKVGELVWEQKIGNPGYNEQGRMVKEDLDGQGFILVGTTTKLDIGKYPSNLIPESDVSDALIVRTDVNGNVTLSRTQGFNGYDIANDVLPVRNTLGIEEYVFVGTTTQFSDGQNGQQSQPINGSDIRFFKNNKSLGNNLESTQGGGSNEFGNAICETSDGGYAIVGSTSSFGSGGSDVYLVQLKLNKENEVTNVQSHVYGGIGDENGLSVQQIQEDGSFIILGTTNSSGNGGTDIYLLKVSATGEEIWTRTYGEEGNESAAKVIVTKDGGFAILGSLRFGNNDMIYLIKTNREGLLFEPNI